MKKINVIKFHSFVDVITNSSTELFVCNTDKTIEAVKEILKKIIDGYNMMSDSNYSMDVFEEPWIFNLEEYRKWKIKVEKIRKACEKSRNWDEYNKNCDSGFSTIKGWFHDDEDKEDLKYLRTRYIEDGDNSGGWWSSDRNPFYHRLEDASYDKNGKYSHDLKRKEVEKIYKEISKEKQKPGWWEKPWLYHYNNTLVKELDGCVIIEGSSDNSIPYEIWNIINSKLCGNNYHLG